MNRAHMRRAAFAAFAIASSLSVPALAAGGGHDAGGGHGEPHVANWWALGKEHADAPALGWMFVTFITFVVVLAVLLKKPLTVHLENRSDQVKRAIEEAKRAKDAAEARAKDAEEKLRSLDTEMARLRAEFESQGKLEAERIEKLARETAARIQKDAEDTIAAERDRAKIQLQQEAGRLALELAEARIKGALSAADDARLQRSLVDHLSS